MFSSISGARVHLGRVTTGRRFYTSKTTSSNWTQNLVLGGLVSASGVWWATSQNALRLDSPEHPAGLSKDQITKILSQNAYSHAVQGVNGVSRYDGTQVASNSPCEDYFFHHQFPSPWKDGKQWMAWAVFDGHAGWQTADLLKHQLLPHVQRGLDHAGSSGGVAVSDSLVRQAIAKSFLRLDEFIFVSAEEAARNSTEPLAERVKKVEPAFAGSCALLSIYDPVTSMLHVACTGDSRAVLGQQRPDGTWDAISLSKDQTGYNEEEAARLQGEHPGEEDTMIKGGRVLGLAVSRAFGDSRWKWSLEFQKEMQKRFYGPAPLTGRYDVKTPPYLTAEPLVTSTPIDPSRPSFLIMASDGLWDNLSNDQAVGLVGKWLGSTAEKRKSPPTRTSSYEPLDFGRLEKETARYVDEREVVEDDNVAVHLTRNSLGGNHHDLIAGRLAFGSPFSRWARDDITVQVVFFNGLAPQ